MNVFDLMAKITLDTNDYERGLNDASGKTESFASKLKSGLSTAAKVGAAALGAASTAIGAVAKQSFDAYASYEQLVGGVETLFGAGGKSVEEYAAANGKAVGEISKEYGRLMMAQNEVMDNAANAYKTAGMSANEYMETVTSFSASLIQSLGGDTQKAAEVADVAITDMSDNANKMGTAIESIQNAYQGFAKQNYTMLDNLKLGYGGTKQEMERLIEDANELKKANGEMADLSIDSYADVVEAIHLVQNEMGITETTAREASSTIEGSLSSMKAAWKNLLTGISDENANLDTLIDNFVESVGTAADNVIPRIAQILEGLGQAVQKIAPIIAEQLPVLIESVLPSLLTAGGQLIAGLIQGIITALPSLVEPAVQVLTQLATFFVQNIPLIISAAGQIISGLVRGLMEAAPQILSVGIEMLSQLANGIINGIPQMVAQLPQVINGFLNYISSQLPTILQQGVQVLMQLTNGIIQAIPQLVAMLPQIINSFTAFMVENGPMILQAGVDLLLNFAMGIIQAIPQLVAQLPQIITSIVNYITANLPMIVQAGIQIIVQLAAGIIQAIPQLVAQLPQVVNAIVNGIGQAASAVVDIGRNIVQGVWNGIQSMGSWIQGKVSGFFSNIVGGVKGLLGIHSPSKVFAGIGGYMAEGLGEGWDAAYRDVEKSINRDMNFSGSISTIGSGSVGSYGTALAGANISINVNGANIQNDKALAERIAFELRNLVDRRAAAFGTA